ncbi:hypothetical protein DL95DRAFT_391069 [Leptodontidium sp. 2 PMI_412]|nr:hypothetical protein DL95DRAFT_391069 [Leptodontidium sp. 2 PMI_412]
MSSSDDIPTSTFRPFASRWAGARISGSAGGPFLTPIQAPDVVSPVTKRKRPNLVGPQTIVKVNVHACGDGFIDGDETHHQSFPIHKNHICHYSPFFDAAFNGNFAEGESQEVDLYEVKPEIFGIFVNWLYTQEIMSEDGEAPSVRSLVYLWLLADRILVSSLQNQAIDLIERTRQQKGNDRLPSEIFPIIYDNTNANSGLRLYVVRVCSAPYLAQIKNSKNYPPQFLLDIVNAIRDRSTGKDRLASVLMTPYHVPEEGGGGDRAKRLKTQ